MKTESVSLPSHRPWVATGIALLAALSGFAAPMARAQPLLPPIQNAPLPPALPGAASPLDMTFDAITGGSFMLAESASASPPWAERHLPAFYVPGEPLTVTLSATPPGGAAACALEDQFPSGWTVSDIGQGGELDAVHGKVKWGPFLDGVPGALTYQVTPPRTTGGPAWFTGACSADGASVLIAGARELGEACRLRTGSQPFPGQFQFTFQGRAGGTFLFEMSTNLITWTRWTTVSNRQGGLWFVTLIQPGTPNRFFRARLAE